MGRAQSDTYSSLFTKSDNVNLDETFDRKSALVHVLTHICQTCKKHLRCYFVRHMLRNSQNINHCNHPPMYRSIQRTLCVIAIVHN